MAEYYKHKVQDHGDKMHFDLLVIFCVEFALLYHILYSAGCIRQICIELCYQCEIFQLHAQSCLSQRMKLGVQQERSGNSNFFAMVAFPRLLTSLAFFIAR